MAMQDNLNPFDALRSERIRLRALEPEDVELMMQCDNDTEAWYASDMVAPYSRKMLTEYAKNYSADPFTDGQLRLVAEDRISGEAIGLADFFELSAMHRRGWCGIYILEKRRNEGLGRELLELMIRYASRILMLRNLAAKIPSDNTVSLKIFGNCGFTNVGILKGWHNSCGKPHDIHICQKVIE